jgi:hypothetical protein
LRGTKSQSATLHDLEIPSHGKTNGQDGWDGTNFTPSRRPFSTTHPPYRYGRYRQDTCFVPRTAEKIHRNTVQVHNALLSLATVASCKQPRLAPHVSALRGIPKTVPQPRELLSARPEPAAAPSPPSRTDTPCSCPSPAGVGVGVGVRRWRSHRARPPRRDAHMQCTSCGSGSYRGLAKRTLSGPGR